MQDAADLPLTKKATGVDDVLQRRRERGRRSQAGFRQRQAEANKAIRDQNARMKVAIEKLVSITRDDDRPELLNVISEVAEAADVDTRSPKEPEPVEVVSKHARKNDPSCAPSHGNDELLNISYKTRDFSLKPGDGAAFRPGSSIQPPGPTRRLNCGIWIDHLHYMKVSLPPEDIIPYLGPRSTTFAGIIFWSLMDHSQNKCPRAHDDIGVIIRRGLSHSKITQSWTTKFVYAMIEARLEYKRTGSISYKYASAAETDLPAMVHGRIEEEYRNRGADPGRWLSAVDIEERVRDMVGEGVFALLEAAAKGEGDAALQYELQTVICKLHEQCVCFGDGPRWDTDFVDKLFLDLVYTAFWFASHGS